MLARVLGNCGHFYPSKSRLNAESEAFSPSISLLNVFMAFSLSALSESHALISACVGAVRLFSLFFLSFSMSNTATPFLPSLRLASGFSLYARPERFGLSVFVVPSARDDFLSQFQKIAASRCV